MHMFLLGCLLLLSTAKSTSYFIVPKNPPEPWKAALMARYIVHTSNYISIGTISTQPSIKGYAYVALASVSDGPVNNSTGVPYLYLSDLEWSGNDIETDNRVTIMASLAQSDFCTKENYDPQDPRCAKVLLAGKLLKISSDSPDYQFGMNSLYERHPSMKTWPISHHFFLSKVDINQIYVLDYFGGYKNVTVTDYFNATTTSVLNSLVNNERNFDKETISVVQISII